MNFKKSKEALGCLGIGIVFLVISLLATFVGNLFDIGKSAIWNKTVGRLINGPEWKQNIENKSYTMAIVLIKSYGDDSIETRTQLEPIIEDLQNYSRTLPNDELEKLILQLKCFKVAMISRRVGSIDKFIGKNDSDNIDRKIKNNVDNFAKNKGLERGWKEFSREFDRLLTQTNEKINNGGLSEEDRIKLLALSKIKDDLTKEMDVRLDWIIDDMTHASKRK